MTIDRSKLHLIHFEPMLSYNHKAEVCWVNGKTWCLEGWCEGCFIYQDWKRDREEALE